MSRLWQILNPRVNPIALFFALLIISLLVRVWVQSRTASSEVDIR
jgi:hypothetical protein